MGNRHSSNDLGLTFSRPPSQRVFFTVYRQKCRLKFSVEKFHGISNLTISADLHGRLAPEESLNYHNQFPCSQKNLSRSVILEWLSQFEACPSRQAIVGNFSFFMEKLQMPNRGAGGSSTFSSK